MELDYDMMDIDYIVGFSLEAFLGLVRSVQPGDYHERAVADAIADTTNIGAWDGGRLVGSVRVMNGDCIFSTVPELLVHPAYRGLGIDNELVRRALWSTPRGRVYFGVPAEVLCRSVADRPE